MNRSIFYLVLLASFSIPVFATQLHRAARDNDIELINRLLAKKKFTVDTLDKEGRPPIYYAILKGNEKMVRHLIDLGARLDWKSKNGDTLLHIAANVADSKTGVMIAAILLDYGADPFERNLANQLPGDIALTKGFSMMAAYLGGLVANTVAVSKAVLGDANTALFRAAGDGDIAEIDLAIAQGADPTQVFEGMTAADLAGMAGHIDTMRYLVTLGAPGIDDDLIAAIAAWHESLQLRTQSESAHGDIPFVISDYEEAKALKKCIQHLLLSKQSSQKTRLLLLNAFGRLLQLHASPPNCMLCLRPGKIAGSHYVSHAILNFVSNYWMVPGSSQPFNSAKMTLPLFCTDSKPGDEKCEQLLSREGEDQFGKYFIPFMKSVIEARQSGDTSDHHIDYDTWLYHCISSLAFRVFLSDLENDENWLSRLESDVMFRAANDSIFEFFDGLRDYILSRGPANHRIFLFLSEDGLADRELPLVHSIGSTLRTEWRHHVLFSIRGFHFLVLSKEPTDSELLEVLKVSKRTFKAVISEKGGRLEIRGFQKALLPKLVRGELDAFTKHHFNDLGNMNYDVLSSAITKMKLKVTGVQTDISQIASAPRYRIMLPDYLKFIPAPNPKLGFQPGTLKSTNKAVVMKAYREIENADVACWIFENDKAKVHFAVIHFGSDETDVVAAWQFDPNSFTRESMLELATNSDFAGAMKTINVMKGTDHLGLTLSDPSAPAIIIASTLLDLVFKDHQPDFPVDDEVLAHRESIKDIHYVRTLQGEERECNLIPSDPDGDCGFTSLQITRKDFIHRVVAAYHSGTDPALNLMIDEAMQELGVQNIEEWAKVFDNRGHWMNFLHLRIASRLYGLRIRIFIVPPQNMIPDGVRGDIFLPLPDETQHIIDETTLAHPSEVNLVWTTMRPLANDGMAVLNHFDRLELAGQAGNEPPTDNIGMQAFDIRRLTQAISSALIYATFIRHKK